MKLTRLKVQGFRSFFSPGNAKPASEDPVPSFDSLPGVEFRVEPLTVLIGPNDCGKSSLLDALELVLSDGKPDPNDFHRPMPSAVPKDESRVVPPVDSIQICLEFSLESDRDELAADLALEGILTLRVTFTAESVEKSILVRVPGDPRLRQDFVKMKAADQTALVQDIDPSALASLSNISQRAEWLANRAKGAAMVTEWQAIPRGIATFLPRFERYSTMAYDDPSGVVLRTLRQVYEAVVFEEVEEEGRVIRRPVEALRRIRQDVEARINKEVQQLLEYIKRYNPRVNTISYDPSIDFSGGLKAGQFQLDDGHGLRYLSKVGDGTKRRMFIAVVDWDREVTLAQSLGEGELPSIIRGYDEPDTNLDYTSQRRMYQSISDIANAPSSRVQAVVCTHSPRLVDQAPARSIRLLSWQDGRSRVSWLRTDEDPAIECFLVGLARELGLTNSLMFYERCFILVEGPTEENALPYLYRSVFGHSLLEDGIRIINVESNGAVKEFLRLLSKNRQDLTLILADLDGEQANKGPKLTRQILAECQFSEEFIRSNLQFIPVEVVGANGAEFEAAFSDEVIARALQREWPKAEGQWQPDDIYRLRQEAGTKFSAKLSTGVWEMSAQDSNSWSKPTFGCVLGQECGPADIPNEIDALFARAREIAGAG